MVNPIVVSDNAILDKIRRNNLEGWEQLYDQHASSMLTVIYRLTGNKEEGEKILIELFTCAKFRNFVLSITTKLGFNLSTFAFSYTVKHMREQGNEPASEIISELPRIFQYLYHRTNTYGESNKEWKPTELIYKSIYVYIWLPVFGINIYE